MAARTFRVSHIRDIQINENVVRPGYLDWFRDQVERAGGGNYQTLINECLRRHMGSSREPFEKTLRRVIREELRSTSWPLGAPWLAKKKSENVPSYRPNKVLDGISNRVSNVAILSR